ncbi:beta-lactamase domain-containing protein [Fictibacillus macauensis ZFHKF-1]|uniref:Beta-lactamase domain-containing protein n=1 Tax=Fictibacillus macauensis ZFHKF-1 TaxID=1196324 RepID=I8UGS3_9BACL|nr:MBL fold metallo-hydrolase [Fictibacillus macauensis]EIT85998.1 beta-lactamase domain-containing protein [Fictibacillus macauensis ZFHKF-1]
MKKIIISAIFVAMLVCLSDIHDAKAAWFEPMKIHFLDVGRADCMFVQMPNGENILVDGGDEHDAARIIEFLQGLGVKTIDLVIATHPHHDHIGSMDEVLETFSVKKIYMPNLPYDTSFYHDLFKVINKKKIPVERAVAGTSFRFGFSAKAELLAPGASYYKYINDYSAVLKITHGNNKFLLMADSGVAAERELLRSHQDLQADVIKVGHHGANTGTTMKFLKAVSAKTAIISCGSQNPNAYPSNVVLGRLAQLNMTVYRTDQLGVITAISNGRSIRFKTNGF